MKLAHGHGGAVNVIATKRDSPLKCTNTAFVMVDAVNGEFLRGIEFRMVIFVNR